ncbi:MAG: hypothetical protein JWQ43_655, partial [Glaciihabitans sp.]|nr:hypothetical protein [Glaciihabitans sp.]
MEDRDLTPPERETLNALLSNSFPGVVELRRQAANVRARSGCECGCPTINLIP